MALFSAAAELTGSTTDTTSQVLVAAGLVALFVLLAVEAAHRVLVAGAVVSAMLLVTYLTPYHLITFEGAKNALDLNVLLLLAGMMALVGVLRTTGAFEWTVHRLLRRAGGRPRVIQASTAWFTGLTSAIADNVTTVVFLTPMVMDMARRTAVPAAAYLLPMVMAANIGGTATLIGDPPNIMIGSGANIPFLAFIQYLAIPVVLMMVMLQAVSYRRFRADMEAAAPRTAADDTAPTIDDPALLRWALGIAGLVFVGFATHSLTGMPVAVPALVGAFTLMVVQDVLYMRRTRPTPAEREHGLLHVIEREIEWPTLSFFAFLFIAVGAAVATGLIDTVAGGLENVIRSMQQNLGFDDRTTVFAAAILICWASGVLSALIDNIPFVAVAIPIVARLTAELPGETSVLWWALALGACLGGNGSAIGASANVTTIGLAEKHGVRISFGAFTRFGAPVTALTLLISSGFLAGYVYLGWATTSIVAVVLLAGIGLASLRRSGR